MLKSSVAFAFLFFFHTSYCQLKWQNVDSSYQPLPVSVHVYYTDQRVQDTVPFRAFYLVADLKDKHLDFTADTSYNRRLTPAGFYQKENHPLLVVNCSFFNFDKNKNLNLLVRDGKLIAYNAASLKNSGKDTVIHKIPFRSAIGIDKKRRADIGWSYTDSSVKLPMLSESVLKYREAFPEGKIPPEEVSNYKMKEKKWLSENFKSWNVQTAVGGGPVLLQDGQIFITNEEELMFTGKAIKDKHPRTAMGYTRDNKLIILVIEGRSESGGGATLTQEAQIFKELGCVEALNLDGGGSSCMLVNGKETIKPSDKEGERPVPAAFLIHARH